VGLVGAGGAALGVEVIGEDNAAKAMKQLGSTNAAAAAEELGVAGVLKVGGVGQGSWLGTTLQRGSRHSGPQSGLLPLAALHVPCNQPSCCSVTSAANMEFSPAA
jgi:hypothetical protein